MISSTVQDFKDIRTILKGFLSSAGYKVLISEDGSIIADSAKETFENCLKAVEASDILIVLIGSRYGTLYDEKSDISITRQEYRHAKELDIQYLVFVDKAVWDARHVYKAYLRKGLPFVESSILADKRIIEFIDEVDEDKKWIHQFSDVADLLKQVKAQLHIVDPQYELYCQPMKGNATNPDGSLNFELGFKNISNQPLLEFYVLIEFAAPVIDIQYDFSRSAVNLTGGSGLSNDKRKFEWSGQMLPTDGWIVFEVKSRDTLKIASLVTKHHGRFASTGTIIRGTG